LFLVCGRIKEVFLFCRRQKAICPKDCGLISPIVGWERKEKLKFSDGTERQATSEFNEVAGGDLGGETCKVSEPLNSCYILPLGIEF